MSNFYYVCNSFHLADFDIFSDVNKHSNNTPSVYTAYQGSAWMQISHSTFQHDKWWQIIIKCIFTQMTLICNYLKQRERWRELLKSSRIISYTRVAMNYSRSGKVFRNRENDNESLLAGEISQICISKIYFLIIFFN